MTNIFMKAGGGGKLLWKRVDAVLSPYIVGNGITTTGDITATNFIGNLADGVTATTQNNDDNSTKIATTKYVDNMKTKHERFDITSAELSSKYVTLLGIISDNQSIRVFLDNVGIKAEQGVDYSVSGNEIYWSGYNLQTTLAEDDVLVVFYI